MDKKFEILSNLYTTASSGAAFSGIDALLKAAKNVDNSISREDVKNFLSTQDSYTLYKTPELRFKREKIIWWGMGDTWSIDIGFLPKEVYQDTNSEYQFLCVVDNFSMYTWVRFIRDRRPVTVTQAFRSIVNECIRNSNRKGPPGRILSDQDTSFKGLFAEFLKTLEPCPNLFTKNTNVALPDCTERYSTFSLVKAGPAESRIRVFKRVLLKLAEHNVTWPRLLQYTPKACNIINSWHSPVLGCAPKDVSVENEVEIFKRRYGNSLEKVYRPSASKDEVEYNIGDRVRTSLSKGVSKSSSVNEPSFSIHIFTVKEVLQTQPKRYKLIEDDGIDLPGSYYAAELQLANSSYKEVITHAFPNRKKGTAEVYYRGDDNAHTININSLPTWFNKV